MTTKLLPVLGAAILAVASVSGSANAATVIKNYTAADMNIVHDTDGTYSANFGQSGIKSGAFQHIYSFTLPAGLLGSATVTTSAVRIGGEGDLDITSVFFNGIELTGTKNARNENVFVNDVPVTAGKVNQIIINGVGRGNGSYGAQAVFAPVPEPASWAMMIGGFGFVGAAMRRRNVRVAFA
ncbi:FxDxF family PEP-CTERM protein [Sphingomonas elodea]|uniref:FxDxF family PEP-CTERM protein n=1 Tax=Sphingomonas elodea TaxID=179878 RepID=UPI0002630840|nr:FxDxF family PEP-CTERM protein [Sphingomonas elodea]